MSASIAIVGRPNVGKSALFNRIAGKRIAIVHNEPGVTRDRISAAAEWQGRQFTLVDTGGIGLLKGEKADDPIALAALKQVELAVESAQVILLVVNAQEGLVPLDREVAKRLRRSGKPVLVAVNKVDHTGLESSVGEFSELGLDEILPVSAIHGIGVDALLQAALRRLPSVEQPIPQAEDGQQPVEKSSVPPNGPLKLAIVGRPNVGKSSLINALTRSERVIVNPMAGTTRDSVDVHFAVPTEGAVENYILIDTAGMRKARSVDDSIEFYSVKRAEASIARADIVVFVLDAEDGIREQDKKIAAKIIEERKACIVLVNKWDLFESNVAEARLQEIARRKNKTRTHEARQSNPTTLSEFGKWVQKGLFFLDYAPVIFGSAKSGFNLERLLEAVRYVATQLLQRIPTALLNRTLHEAVEHRQPISARGERLKFFYATQVEAAPPLFLLFVNRDDLLSPSYEKYLTRELRKAFGFEGCPIRLVAKPRAKTIPTLRRGRRIAR